MSDLLKRMFAGVHLCLTLAGLLASTAAAAGEAMLTVKNAGQTIVYKRAELLARPDIQTVTVPADVAYDGKTMTYQAIPIADLLAETKLPRDSTIQVTATDGFIAHLPAKALAAADVHGAHAYLAIEPATAPWPRLTGKSVSAGAFYIVWTTPEAAQISPEQWPYQIATIESTLDPVLRWPQITLAADHAGSGDARRCCGPRRPRGFHRKLLDLPRHQWRWRCHPRP